MATNMCLDDQDSECKRPTMPDGFVRFMQEIQSAHSWAEGAVIYCAHNFGQYTPLQRERANEIIQDALAELPEFPE